MIVDSKGTEFGYELIQVIPWAYWLYKKGELEGTISSKDTAPLYYFSPSHLEEYNKRKSGDILGSNFPIKNIHQYNLDLSKWTPPPYKEYYKNEDFLFNKDLVIITNKYAIEWGERPQNFYSLEMLRALFKYLNPKYQIIYHRAKHKTEEAIIKDLNEKDILKSEFPEIILFEDLLDKNNIGYNLLQLKLFANCDNFISMQGGSSILSSYFAKNNFIYAVKGQELNYNSYNNWYHEFSGSKIYHHNNYKSLIKNIKEIL